MKTCIIGFTVLIVFIQAVLTLAITRPEYTPSPQKPAVEKREIFTTAPFIRNQAPAPLVQVDLFVMSKCPDASVCESLFLNVIKQVGNITDLRVNYIAKNSGGSFQCMHGNSECIGNIQQLCVTQLYPKDYAWFNFVTCQDETQFNIPNNAQSCASRQNLNWANINTCANGDQGQKLFKDSVAYTQSFGVGTSCTIYLQKNPRCVHDGVWKNCPGGYEVHDFVRDICSNYSGTKPNVCLIN
jgi:hypothetical protein